MKSSKKPELKKYRVNFYYTQEVIVPGSIVVLASSKEAAEEAVWDKHWSGEIEMDGYLEDSYTNDSEFNICECEEIN